MCVSIIGWSTRRDTQHSVILSNRTVSRKLLQYLSYSRESLIISNYLPKRNFFALLIDKYVHNMIMITKQRLPIALDFKTQH